MSKGLEALDKIINSVDGYTYYAESLDREYEIVQKELKALEIITEKNVAITMIKQTQSVTEYNMFAYDFLQVKRVDKEKYKLSPQPLDEEEYDLLKEVFL